MVLSWDITSLLRYLELLKTNQILIAQLQKLEMFYELQKYFPKII